MIADLKEFLAIAKGIKQDIRKLEVDRVSKKDLKTRVENLATAWFSSLQPRLIDELGMSSDILEKYGEAAGRLLSLVANNNLKKSYLQTFEALIKSFNTELIIPAQTNPSEIGSIALLHRLLADLPNEDENEYLSEAVKCAQRGFFRAAAVMGWCAAIDRIHRKIVDFGIQKFNVASVRMATQTKGRYKRFSSPQSVSTLSELREVFDTNVLWIIEGMGFIDSNQHTRLKSCFDIRNQSAHPGQVTISEFNLMSFFSDIDQIVLRNPTFIL